MLFKLGRVFLFRLNKLILNSFYSLRSYKVEAKIMTQSVECLSLKQKDLSLVP